MKDLFLTVTEISLSTGLVILVLLALSPLLNRRYAAKWKYGIWMLLALRLAVPLSLELPKKQIVLDVPQRVTAPIVIPQGPPIVVTAPRPPQISLLDILAWVWLAGCIAFLLVHGISYVRYRRSVMRNCVEMKNEALNRHMEALCRELNIRRPIPILVCSEAASPMVLGFVRPLLIFPSGDYAGDTLFFVLKHELIHLKRRDVLGKLLLVLSNAIHWFNPLVYWMQREAVVDMELSCDERVVRGTGFESKRAYTETLLATLCRQYKKSTTFSTQFYGGKEIMKKRFKNILNRSKKRNGFLILAVVVMATLTLGLLIGCSAQEPATLETLAQASEAAASDVAVVIAPNGKLNIRKEPTTKSETVGTLTDGDQIEIVEIKDGWVRIPGGWISLDYVQLPFDLSETTPDRAYADAYQADLNIRENPTVKSNIVGKLKENEKVEILETQGNWGRIAEGWIYLDFVNLDTSRVDLSANKESAAAARTAIEFAMARFQNDMDAMRKFLSLSWEGMFWHVEFNQFPKQNELAARTVYREGDSKDFSVGGTVTMSIAVHDGDDSDNFIVCLIREPKDWKVYDFGFEDMEGFGKPSDEANVEETGVSSEESLPAVPEWTLNDEEALPVWANDFADAYFAGDEDTMKAFLLSPDAFDGVYGGKERVQFLSVKGSDISTEGAEPKATWWAEFRESADSDTVSYLRMDFVKRSGAWKIQWYALEK